jgi:hypothetical protein
MTIDLTQVLTVFAIVATNLITVITLYIHTDSKMEANLKGIRDEMKDFHNAMQEISRDFHGRLIAIEEKRSKILEG